MGPLEPCASAISPDAPSQKECKRDATKGERILAESGVRCVLLAEFIEPQECNAVAANPSRAGATRRGSEREPCVASPRVNPPTRRR